MRSPLIFLALAACTQTAAPPAQTDARALHEKLLVLDTHLDTPTHFGRPGWSMAASHTFANDMSQVDLPRMREGGLDGGFFVIYTPQGPLTPQGFADAKAFALKRADEIAAVAAANADAMTLATRADEAAKIAASGKRVVYQSIENSYPLGEDLTLLEEFYRRGVRMAGPVHSKDNQFADSTTGDGRWKGLSPLGRKWVAEMNRLGMVIDGSHSSDATFDQMLELSKTPLILSHSGPKAAFEHPRNIDDARLRKLAAKGGVVQLNSLFLSPSNKSAERDALSKRAEALNTLTPEEQRKLAADFAALDARAPANDASFEMFMASLLHTLKVVGVDHVGIGADWDGGGGVKGMNDVAALPRITEALLKAGYSEADIAKIWSGNVLRVLAAADKGRTP